MATKKSAVPPLSKVIGTKAPHSTSMKMFLVTDENHLEMLVIATSKSEARRLAIADLKVTDPDALYDGGQELLVAKEIPQFARVGGSLDLYDGFK